MNLGTTIVLVVLIGIISLIIFKMVRDKKKGKSMVCGCDCGKCGGSCGCK